MEYHQIILRYHQTDIELPFIALSLSLCAANPIPNPIPHHLHIAEHMSPASRRNGSSPPSGPLPPRSVHSPNSSG